uniref:Tat-binding homolog 7 n=1 Tax=Caenorhabditis japonica TaxID=281687 RepID=A0A8R1HZS2_CAEJA
MPRRDGLSPRKSLRRSTREHSSRVYSLQDDQLEDNDPEYDDIYSPPTRRRSGGGGGSGYTRSGRKIHHSRYYEEDAYEGAISSEDDERRYRTRRSSNAMTYRQQVMQAIDESKRSQKAPAAKRKRIYLSDEEDDEFEAQLQVENTLPVLSTRRSSRRRTSIHVEAEGSEQEESPIRRSRRSATRLQSGDCPAENGEIGNEGAVMEGGGEPAETNADVDGMGEEGGNQEQGVGDGEDVIEKLGREEEEEGEDEEGEDQKDEEEEEDSSNAESSEESTAPRQYSLRRRQPVVHFNSGDARDRLARHERQKRLPPSGGANRHHRNRKGSSHRRRSDSDSDSDDLVLPRPDKRQARPHMHSGRGAGERGRFMPINMTEKELQSAQHILMDRMRKTDAGQGASDIDPMSVDSSVGFDQVGGLGHHIQSLKEVVLFPMLYPEVFSKFSINPPKGVVFYGPPGTGKTLVARALANECRRGANKVAFFMRKGADCLSKWVGESERQLRLLFDQAYAMRPSIIFFDEIDGLAPVRSSKQDQIHASIVSTLLALMDGLDGRGEVVVIGATNRLDSLDPALRRPGRFDRELRFSLPDLNARRQILDIHTSKWEENKPEPQTIDSIAEKTSGYCGADLKFLCTEAVLIGLRSRYPHIYMCSERLKLDIATIKVTEEHFGHAMRRITPASRRDLTIPSRPLDERTSILLGDTIDNLISLRIPQGYRCVENAMATASCELEQVVRALEPNPTVPAIRLLICGSPSLADGGQTSYVLPAILAKLDHLPVFSLSVSSLLTDGRPEEAFSHAVQAAMRASATGPCIMLLPSIDEWIKVIPVSVQHMLITCLESMTGFTPILFLSTLDSSFEHAPDFVTEVFRHANCINMNPSRKSVREKYFDHVFEPIHVPPKVFDPTAYEMPKPDDDSPDAKPTRKLNEDEQRELLKMYTALQRQMRMFFKERLARLMRDRRFAEFVDPVDPEEAEDYYEIIKNPICLSDIMEKLNKSEYNHADKFVADLCLIQFNALDYNPSNTKEGKMIRQMANSLRDAIDDFMDCELDESFVERIETVSRMLQDAGVTSTTDQLLTEIPKGFVRRKPWSMTNTLAKEIEQWKAEREAENQKVMEKLGVAVSAPSSSETVVTEDIKSEEGTSTSTEGVPASGGKKKLTKKKPVKKLKKNGSEEPEEENSEETGEETAIEDYEEAQAQKSSEELNDVEMKEDSGSLNSLDATLTPGSPPSGIAQQELIISRDAIDDVRRLCVTKSDGWSVSELERLSSVLSHTIERFRNDWNREGLPDQLSQIVTDWQAIEDPVLANGTPSLKNGSLLNGH